MSHSISQRLLCQKEHTSLNYSISTVPRAGSWLLQSESNRLPISQPITITSCLDAWRNSAVKFKYSSSLLNKLPIEIATRILKLVCTSDRRITSCALSNFKYQHDYPYSESIQRTCGCYRNFEIDPVLLKTLKDTAAVSLTCRAFQNIVSGEALLYKSNTFEFCTLDDVERCLEKIPQRKRNAIRSIHIHYRFTKNNGARLSPLHMVSTASTAFKAIQNCTGLRSLIVCPDSIPSILAYYRIYVHELPGLADLVAIRGLQEFDMKVDRGMMALWLHRCKAARFFRVKTLSDISQMGEVICALVILDRVDEKAEMPPRMSASSLKQLFDPPMAPQKLDLPLD